MEHLLGPAQSKADDLGYVPLKESMLMQSRSAVRKIGK
jgi:phosphate transport system substrate-binding protein